MPRGSPLRVLLYDVPKSTFGQSWTALQIFCILELQIAECIMESAQCSRCRCVRAVAAFKESKAGKRNKTCMRCSSGAPKVADSPALKVADEVADPPAPKVADEVADLPAPKVADEVAERGRSRQRKVADEHRDTRVSSRAEDELFTMIDEMMLPGMDWSDRAEWYIGFDIDINALNTDGYPPRADEVLRRLRIHNLRPKWLDPSAH